MSGIRGAMPSARCLVFLAAAGLQIFPLTLSAQERTIFHELGAFAEWGRSNHPELPSPSGFGVSSLWEVNRFVLARLSFHRLKDGTSKPGTVCRVYSQRIDCRTETTETSVTLSGLRGSVMGTVPVGARLRMALGGGLSFNHINAKSVGESGMRADLLSANAGQIGFSALLNAAVRPLTGAPLKVTGSMGAHWVDFNACSGEDPPQYDPFCGLTLFKELELGLTYVF